MMLQQLEWQKSFIDCGISNEETKTYSESFAKNIIQRIEDLSKELLHDLGIAIIGDVLAILRTVKKDVKPHCRSIGVADSDQDSKIQKCTPHNATLPPVKAEITSPEFRRFKVD